MKRDKWLILVADKIKTARVRAGYSAQEKFSKVFDIDRTYYGKIEAAKANPTLLKLFDIAIALDVDPAELCPSLADLKKSLKEQ